MNICESDVQKLRSDVKKYMSEKRYAHTVGVESTAEKLADYCLPEKKTALRCAALLHDISKELSDEEQIAILKRVDGIVESDLLSPPAHHAFTAPTLIKRDFPHLATDEILSAVFNHTTGAEDMSVFDEIIFISDYVEPGRKYIDCINVREKLFAALSSATDREECVMRLHEAVIEALNNTINSLIKREMYINERTVAARNSLLGKLPMPLKGLGEN